MSDRPAFRVSSREAGEDLVIFLARPDSMESAEELGRIRMVACRAAGQPAVVAFLVAIAQGMGDAIAGRPTPPPTALRKGSLN